MLRRPFPPRGPLKKPASFIFPASSSKTSPYLPVRYAGTRVKYFKKPISASRAPPPSSQHFMELERDRCRNWVPRPLEGFKGIVSDENPKALDATRAHRIYYAYREAELQNVKNRTSIDWKRDFVKSHGVTLSELHDIALHMFRTPRAPSDGRTEDWNYASRLMETAGELGYRPAVLDLVRRIIQTRPGATGLDREFSQLHRRFRDIVAEDCDPNAQTLQGMLYAKQGDHARALQFLQRAKALAGADGSFHLKPLCLSQMGMILEKQGKQELAESEYAELARDNTGLGFYHLGMLYKAEPVARWLLQKAASSGVHQAMRELGNIELTDYEKAVEDGHQEAAQRHLADSQEWHRLASAWSSTVPPTNETY
ncbi:hypothetical protein ACRALDRAFT_1082754 [Sodiomyces alcalophilus JCM 7366]|uniref:uncharacterized protein n=1 Tax=Sodiomyces alcalophilus JCM 7366 TaxID=591952 RepID=UPI0039B5B627